MLRVHAFFLLERVTLSKTANEFLMWPTRPKLTAEINLKLDAQTWQREKWLYANERGAAPDLKSNLNF
jgi:hypothetical protein